MTSLFIQVSILYIFLKHGCNLGKGSKYKSQTEKFLFYNIRFIHKFIIRGCWLFYFSKFKDNFCSCFCWGAVEIWERTRPFYTRVFTDLLGSYQYLLTSQIKMVQSIFFSLFYETPLKFVRVHNFYQALSICYL